MKTYALEDIASRDQAIEVLRLLLPGQENPWLLKDQSGDAIAYFRVGLKDLKRGGLWVVADVSGRHYFEDAAVVGVLRQVQGVCGGVLLDDDGNVV